MKIMERYRKWSEKGNNAEKTKTIISIVLVILVATLLAIIFIPKPKAGEPNFFDDFSALKLGTKIAVGIVIFVGILSIFGGMAVAEKYCHAGLLWFLTASWVIAALMALLVVWIIQLN